MRMLFIKQNHNFISIYIVFIFKTILYVFASEFEILCLCKHYSCSYSLVLNRILSNIGVTQPWFKALRLRTANNYRKPDWFHKNLVPSTIVPNLIPVSKAIFLACFDARIGQTVLFRQLCSRCEQNCRF